MPEVACSGNSLNAVAQTLVYLVGEVACPTPNQVQTTEMDHTESMYSLITAYNVLQYIIVVLQQTLTFIDTDPIVQCSKIQYDSTFCASGTTYDPKLANNFCTGRECNPGLHDDQVACCVG